MFDAVIEGTLEEIRSTEDEEDSSVLMVKVTTMFKGPESIQNKIIKIKFADNLNIGIGLLAGVFSK